MGASLSAGHYMVVSTSKGSLPMGHKATLTSAPYQPSAPAQCLAFWYQLSTGDPGEPHVPLAMYRRSAQDAWVLWGSSRWVGTKGPSACYAPHHGTACIQHCGRVPGQVLSASLWRRAGC